MEYYKNLDLKDIVYFCEFDLIEKTEQWKDVVGYEGMYQVSDLGRVKSMERQVKCSDNRLLYIKSKIISSGINKKTGYISVSLWKNNLTKRFTTHRLLAMSFIPNLENKLQVNHINGIKTHNNIKNLEWATKSENALHSYKNNLSKQKKGEDSIHAKLTEKQVLIIRRLFNINPKFIRKKVAKKYNVNSMTISCIIYRKSWTNI